MFLNTKVVNMNKLYGEVYHKDDDISIGGVINNADVVLKLLDAIKGKTGMDLSYCDTTKAHLSVKVTTINIPSGHKYFDSAIGYDDLPNNAYVNKQITGCGMTTLAITNNIDYIIAVPTLNLIENKCEKHESIIPFHGGISNKDFYEYYEGMLDSNTPIKIMTTYDSLKRLCTLINTKKFKILIDEAHQLINIGLFRKGAVHNVLQCFKEFNSYVFVTATPTTFRFFPTELRDVEFIELKWKDAVKVEFPVQKIKIKGMHYLVNHCLSYLRGEIEGNLHLFINSVDTIITLIRKLKKYKDYDDSLFKIVCSDTEYNTAKIAKNLTTLFIEKSLRVPKKINLYTSCCWCGSDIEDEDGKVVIYVDNSLSITKVCLKTQVPQIIGRIRNSKYQNDMLMMLVGDMEELEEPNEYSWFIRTLSSFLSSLTKYDVYHQFKDTEFGDKIANDIIRGCAKDPFLIYDNSSDDMYYNTVGILAEMEKYSIIHTQYWKLGSEGKAPQQDCLYTACITDDRIVSPIGDVDRANLGMRVNYSKLMKQYIKAVSMNDITRVSEIDAVIPDCKIHLNSLGAKKIASAKYSHNRVNDMYTNYVLKTKYRKDIVKDMGLLVGGTYPNDTVKVLLKESYTKHLIKESASLMNLKFFYEFEEKQIRSGVNRISSINITGVKE